MKEIKTQGNFMVYGPQGERRAAFALESDKRLFEAALEEAAQPTLGPWFDWAEYREQHGRSVVAYRDESDAIVSVLNCEQQEANARLIAAVPDLLAALQLVKEDIAGFLSGEWDGNADGWRCTLAGLNAVLALPDVEAGQPVPAPACRACGATGTLDSETSVCSACGWRYAGTFPLEVDSEPALAAAPDDCPDDYETNLRHVSIR